MPVNIAGLPAISIPCGADVNGMPIGLQIIGRAGEDFSVLDCAYFAEREDIFKDTGRKYTGGASDTAQSKAQSKAQNTAQNYKAREEEA